MFQGGLTQKNVCPSGYIFKPPPGQNPVYASELNIVFKGSFYDLTKKETSLWLQEIVHIKNKKYNSRKIVFMKSHHLWVTLYLA